MRPQAWRCNPPTRIGAASAGGASPERRFRIVTAVLGAVFAVYTLATLMPTPSALLSVARNVFVLPIPFVTWWAHARSPAPMRRSLFLFGVAALVWMAGTAIWYAEFFAAGNDVPKPPGPADGFFLSARILIIAAIVAALRSVMRPRIAALDASVVIAAGLAVGAALIGHRLEEGFSASTLVTLNGPILGVLILMLIASAAIGSWEGISRFFAFFGAGIVALTAGTFIYSYHAVRETYADDRWSGLVWAAAAVLILLAATVIILGVDRPLRIVDRAAIPNHPPGSNSVLLLFLGALALTLGVALYGDVAEIRTVALVGVGASVAIGIAMALRAREAIRTAEDAYARLDRALAESERARDELAAANEDLVRVNMELRVMHTAFADLLNLADERSSGRMRELIEDTGDELAKLLEEEMEQHRPRY